MYRISKYSLDGELVDSQIIQIVRVPEKDGARYLSETMTEKHGICYPSERTTESEGTLIVHDSLISMEKNYNVEQGVEENVEFKSSNKRKSTYPTYSLPARQKIDTPKVVQEVSSMRKAWKKIVKEVNSVFNKMKLCPRFGNRQAGLLSKKRPHVALAPSAKKKPGITGLENHGNTCYINAVLQCLTQTDCFAKYFVTNQYKMDLTRKKPISKKYVLHSRVTEQLVLLLKSIWHCQYDSILTYHFKLLVGVYGVQYGGDSQHDAQEFLIWLLNKVHEELNFASNIKSKKSQGMLHEKHTKETLGSRLSPKNNFIQDTFQAQFKSTLMCLNCRFQTHCFDPFFQISVPVPQNHKRPIYVTVLYLSRQPRQVRLGVSLNRDSLITDLREHLSYVTGIAKSCMLLTNINAAGFQRTFSSHLPISEIKKTDPLYCIEMPRLRNPLEETEEYVLLCWINVMTIDGHYFSRFGRPYAAQISRSTRYDEIEKFLLKAMKGILSDEVFTSRFTRLPFRIKIADCISRNVSSSTYLDPFDNCPLYVSEVNEALALLDEASGPKHLKLILEWDISFKKRFIADDREVIEEDSSAKELLAKSGNEEFVTLQECFNLFTGPEILTNENKWRCPFCIRKQEVSKTLRLLYSPDILVIHLKRFQQRSLTSNRVEKLKVMVDFPIYGFDLNPHVVDPSEDPTSPSSRKGCKIQGEPYSENVYDLYAVCNHHGEDLNHGHYTAFCLNPYDRQWYCFDDEKVQPILESDVVTDSAYILFYEKRRLASGSGYWVTHMPAFDLAREYL